MLAWLYAHTGSLYLVVLVAAAVAGTLAVRQNAAMREAGSLFAYLRNELAHSRQAQCLFVCLVVFQLGVIALSVARLFGP